MLPELSARLTKVVEQKWLKVKLEQDFHAVEKEYFDQSERLESLGTKLDKEKIDVEKLERTSLTGLFYSVLGSCERQLEKERQELLSVQLKYQQAKYQVDFLKRERDRLLQQLEEFRDVDSEYGVLLSEKDGLLCQSNQSVARELFSLSEQIAYSSSEIKEIAEALTVGKNVILGLTQVIKSLESAKNWGVWDVLGGGLISTAIKHSRIDDARRSVQDVQTKMSQFKGELADVQKNVELQINIGEFESFADFFFDGLIIDWIVQSKIVGSSEQSNQAKDVISQAVAELEILKMITQSKVSDL